MLVKRRLMDELADQIRLRSSAESWPSRNTSRSFTNGSTKNTVLTHRHADGKDHEEAHTIEPDADQEEEFQDIANRRVRLGLLLNEIGRANNIQIGQDDMNQAMMQEARKYPGQEQQVMEYFKKQPTGARASCCPDVRRQNHRLRS